MARRAPRVGKSITLPLCARVIQKKATESFQDSRQAPSVASSPSLASALGSDSVLTRLSRLLLNSPDNQPLGEFLVTPDTDANTTIVRAQFNSLGFPIDRLQAPPGQDVVAANGQLFGSLGKFSLVPSTLDPALLLIGSQLSAQWTGFFWRGTSLEIWEFSLTTTPPSYLFTPKPCIRR